MIAPVQVFSSQGHPFPCVYQTLSCDHYRQQKHKFFSSPYTRFRAHTLNTEVTMFGSILTSLFIPGDIRFRAHISDTRGDHVRQQQNKSFHPKDILFARVFNNRGDHVPPPNKYHPSKDTRVRVNISNTPDDHLRQLKTNPPIARTSIFVRIFQTLKVTILGSFKTSPFIPRTSFLAKFKQFYVSFRAICAQNRSFFSEQFVRAHDMVDGVSKSPILNASRN